MTKTLISFLQITYQEFLPSVLGTRAWKAAGLDSQEVSGQYGQYVQGVVRVVMGVQCGHVGQGDQAGEGVVRGVRVIRLVSGWPGVFSVVRVIRG